MDAITHIWTGRAGLAKTYWGFGVAAGLLWSAVLSAVQPGSAMAKIAVLTFCIYFIAVGIGVWRAASQYEGAAVWAALAKIAAAVSIAFVTTVMVSVLTSMMRGGMPSEPTIASSAPTDGSRSVVPPPAVPSAPAPSANFATCILDSLPGAANDMVADAMYRLCLKEHPREFADVQKGSGRSVLGFSSGDQCLLSKGKDTTYQQAAKAIAAACNCLYNKAILEGATCTNDFDPSTARRVN